MSFNQKYVCPKNLYVATYGFETIMDQFDSNYAKSNGDRQKFQVLVNSGVPCCTL